MNLAFEKYPDRVDYKGKANSNIYKQTKILLKKKQSEGCTKGLPGFGDFLVRDSFMSKDMSLAGERLSVQEIWTLVPGDFSFILLCLFLNTSKKEHSPDRGGK